MSEKSFYDLDYIIEINEHRLEQYTTAYQKVLERLTHIILIYSGITIFLIPLIRDSALFRIRNPVFISLLILFLALLLVSLVYTVRLIIPGRGVYLDSPRRYYEEYRMNYETSIDDKGSIEKLLKASYISELQEALATSEKMLKIKESFHYNAMIFALLSVAPYLICLTFHLAQKDDNIQKIQIVNTENSCNFMKTDTVFKSRKNKKTSEVAPKQIHNLPGVDNSLVLDSHPVYRWENSSVSYTFDMNGKKVYLK